jgi:hypothetical protein
MKNENDAPDPFDVIVVGAGIGGHRTMLGDGSAQQVADRLDVSRLERPATRS